ncbi:MAG: S9 family peptidase, partial [Arenibacter sp.]
MKTLILIPLVGILLFTCKNTQKKDTIILNYPNTKKVDSVDTYFGIKIQDPFRWLEDDQSPETENWVKEQNKTTFNYLDKIPFRKELKKRLEQLWDFEKLGSPFEEGNYIYFFKNDGLQNQNVLYRKKGEEAEAEVFLDPNSFSEDATTSLAGINFSKDGSIAAYSISEGGSDWRKVIVINAENKSIVEDTLVDIKFSGVSWKGNEGFFYSSYDKPEGSELSAKTDQHKLYYHKLGTPQKSDKVVFGGIPGQKHRYVGGYVTEDDRYLIISAAISTSGNKLFIKDLTQPESELLTILNTTDSDSQIIDNVGPKLFILTNRNAPNKKVVTVEAENPTPENWTDLIPETQNVLSVGTGGGYFFAEYMVDAISKVYQYDNQGKMLREIALPGLGSAGGFGGKKKETALYFSFTNYNNPESIYKLDIKTGDYTAYWKPEIDFNPEDYVSTQVFYP